MVKERLGASQSSASKAEKPKPSAGSCLGFVRRGFSHGPIGLCGGVGRGRGGERRALHGPIFFRIVDETGR